MADDQAHELRILVERIADLKTQVAAFPTAMASYVRLDVYEARELARQARFDALAARVERLEAADSSKATGNRTWLLGLAQTAFGAVLALVGAYLMSKGHG